MVVDHTIRAMAAGSMEAADLFPRVLDCLGTYGDASLSDVFRQRVRHVPAWMLLRWVGQMMAHLDKPHAPAVVEVLLMVADAFPQALFYPFKVSRSAMPDVDEAVVAPLADKLHNELLETFSTALGLYVSGTVCTVQRRHQAACGKDWLACTDSCPGSAACVPG